MVLVPTGTEAANGGQSNARPDASRLLPVFREWAGTGAAVGAIVGGNPGTGALIGGAVGAAGGALTSGHDVNLGKPVWR